MSIDKPTIILATSNGIGMGHLVRATTIAMSLKEIANPIIVSMAGGIAEIPSYAGIRCEYIPGRDRLWMSREKWDQYLKERLVALFDETDARLISFDGAVPYPGVVAARSASPNTTLIWVRRGLWQKTLQRFVLGIQASMMDVIIEPGDIAQSYDHGPTSKRRDAIKAAPVSLFKETDALSREDACRLLNLDPNRPAALVQLGTGDLDVNKKMTAALEGLLGWKDLQVVVTKEPVDKEGNSLAPKGLELKIVSYFPLAKVLHAFDAAICAAGYNSVHELLPARVPTVFISNTRGTDDQEMRAKWCHDHGFALRANQADLAEITNVVKQLQDHEVRNNLSEKCAELPATNGGTEIAKILFSLATQPIKKRNQLKNITRLFAQQFLRRATLIYRFVKPHSLGQPTNANQVIFTETTDAMELQKLIKSGSRFEHLIAGASNEYRIKREVIAQRAYGSSSK